jgi:hypothetical protein
LLKRNDRFVDYVPCTQLEGLSPFKELILGSTKYNKDAEALKAAGASRATIATSAQFVKVMKSIQKEILKPPVI